MPKYSYPQESTSSGWRGVCWGAEKLCQVGKIWNHSGFGNQLIQHMNKTICQWFLKINITMIFRCMEQLKKLDLKPWPITQIVVILYDLIWKLLLRNRKDKTTQKKKDFSLGPSHISIIHIISILYACYIRIINVLQSSITFADDLPFVQRGKMLHLVVT